MRALLRFFTLLLAWAAFGPTTAWAQTPDAKTATVGNNPALLYNIPSFTATGGTAVRYGFFTVPTSGLVAYPTNTDGSTGGGFSAATANITITAAQAMRLVYQPANTTNNAGVFPFNYGASSQATGTAFNGPATYTINVRIVADEQTAVIMPNTNAQTAIPALSATSSPTVPSKYRILALPSASAGTLYVNAVAATANQDLTTAQASQLTFAPTAGFAGNAFFTYAAADASNNFGPSANYSLPVSKAACGVTSGLDFSRRTAGEDWKSRTVMVGNTMVTTSGYSTTVTGANTNTFAVGNNGTLPGPALVWQQNNIGNNPSTTPNVTMVTYTFSRPVSNLSMVVSDIDKDLTNANFTDEITFDSYSSAGSATPITLGAADVATVAGINQLVSGTNTIQGIGTSDANPAGTVVITFPSPVQRITLAYRNTAPFVSAATDRTQTVGIPSLIFCAQADVTTTLVAGTTPSSVGASNSFAVTYSNASDAGVDPANGVIAQVQLPANLPGGVTFTATTAGVTGTYTASSGLVTFTGAPIATLAAGASVSSTINFTVPSNTPTVTVTSTVSTITNEPTPNNPNTATASIEVSRIAGNIFEDPNYGGGAGRLGTASGAIAPAAGTRIELYQVVSGVPTNLLAATTSDASGNYAFLSGQTAGGGNQGTVPTLASGQNYVVRVVNNGTSAATTVTSTRLITAGTLGIVPVQTFVSNGVTDDVNRVGGENPARTDAAAGTTYGTATGTLYATLATATTVAQSVTTVTLPATVVRTGVDFGFNYDVVVNTNDTGQGSLRQFITNSNALSNTGLAQVGQTAGKEVSIFMISDGRTTGTIPAGTRSGVSGGAASGGVATITLATTLPNITDPNTTVSGLTQTALYGDTSLPVPEVTTGPEVIINFNGQSGLTVAATGTNAGIIGLGLTGTLATGGSTTGALSILAASSVVQNNTMNNNGANMRINGAGGATVTGNVFRDALANNADGIELTSSAGNTISNNQFLNNAGYGIDFITGASDSNTITGNLFKNNGQNSTGTNLGQTAGIGIRSNSSNNVISGNIFTANVGDGISAKAGTNNVFSQNSFFNNGDLGIDLTGAATNDGDGVTVNTAAATRTGANNLINFPVLTTATVNGTNLVVNGYARPGVLVELYLATADPTGFGEGSSYLINFTQGMVTGTTGNVVTGAASTYGPANINGLNQGTDNTNTFTVTIPLSSLTAAQRVALLGGSAVLTSTATGTGSGTSEFSGNLVVPVADVTTALTGPASVNAGQPTGTYTATFTNEGPSIASNVTRQATLPANATNVVLPAGAMLTGSVIDFGTAATLASGASSAFSFSFTPATTATGTQVVTSNVTTATAQGSNAAPDASTITATVAPTANVAATITATTPSVAAGTLASAGTPPKFTVVFSNSGPATAAGVVASVQLPRQLTNVVANNNGVYDPNTGIVSYATLTSIANGGSTTSVITFDAPATGPVVANASIATTTSEASQTANNTAAATVIITPAFDLTTSISGPTSAVAGNLVTLAVTTTNNGPSAATNAVQTLQLATGLSNVYVSNGGVYNPATTTQTIVSNGVSYSVPAGGVVFPTLPNLPSGQTVANSVSYSQPATAFAPSALVTPNTASTATTAGDTNTANNTAFLNGAATSTSLTVTPAAAGTANAYTTITSSAATTTVGSAVTLTVVTGNSGPNQATGVTQTVQILPGFTTATIKVNGNTGMLIGNVITFTGGATYNTQTGFVTFATLTDGTSGSTSGTSVSNTITFNAPASTGANGQLLAMAAVRTTNIDPIPADNVASVAVTLLQSTDLMATISGPASATAGQLVTYTASFTNNGPMTATGVTETTQLPAGLGTVTITDAAGNAVSGASYSATTGLVTFSTLSLDPSGTTQVFNISFAAPAQSFSPRSSVGSTSPDAVPANNSASVTTTVAPAADLTTTVAGPATAVIGNAVTYSVTTTNNGPSAATNAITTLQLATNLTTVSVPNGTYNAGSGLVTFNTLASLASGASTTNSVTFVMPNAASGQTTGVSTASADQIDPIAGNNASSVATSIAPATPTSADLTAAVTATTGPVAPGATITFTATYGNIGADPGLNVMPTLQLTPGFTTATIQVAGQTGTLSGNTISFANGATYNTQTGLVAFPTIASQATGAAANLSYAVTVTAPATGPQSATAITTSNTSEPATTAARTNNVASASTPITALYDAVTSIGGPASALPGTSQTYTVTMTNNGPSLTANATTQTVTVPAGQTPTNITNGGMYSNTANTITWTVAAGQGAGSNGAVANSFTIVQPAAGVTLTATVAVTGESNTANNTATITTTASNQPPLAFAVVNSRQSATGTTNNPMGNNVANNPATPNGLLISSLMATDPENALSSTAPYTITSLPTTTQGMLFYDNGGTYTAVTVNKTLTATQATTLRFLPNTAFTGNATFTYLSTDAAGNTSPVVSYTIPVAQDVSTTYTKYNSGKGMANKYVNNDILAQTIDLNAAQYTSAGFVYDASTGVLLSGAANGLPVSGTNAVITAGTLPAGVSLDPITGRIFVSNASLLPTSRSAQNFTVTIRTIDINGGTNTVPVTFTLGAFPLPVELTDFTATAVKNLDAVLLWHTAQEKNNDHFDVERSLNGTDFVKINEVKGQGSKTTPTEYALNDAGIGPKAKGLVYYRLKQVDTDGTTSYSPVRTVAFTTAAALTPAIGLFPNPATSGTQLDLRQLPTGRYQVSVLDATGRVVLNTTLEAGLAHALDLNTIASGTYNVLVRGQSNGQNITLTKRLIKE